MILLRYTWTTVPQILRPSFRAVSTLTSNPHIHIFPSPSQKDTHLLSFLSTDPPTQELALASTTKIPPTPESVMENKDFMDIMQDVIAKNAIDDPQVKTQASAYASAGGAGLGGAGLGQEQPQTRTRASRRNTGADTGAGAASAQGGTGGAGVGGWIHVSDMRNPPDWGRIAWPEDIFGSLQVDGQGGFVGDRGGYQRSGTYRLCTNEGILGLSPFLREKLVQRLSEIEKDMRR